MLGAVNILRNCYIACKMVLVLSIKIDFKDYMNERYLIETKLI